MAKKKEPIWATNKRGRRVRLLRPDEKSRKYATELKRKVRLTNNGEPKVDRNGVALGLTKDARAYRAGYLQARKDNTNLYNWTKKHSDGNKARGQRKTKAKSTDNVSLF